MIVCHGIFVYLRHNNVRKEKKYVEISEELRILFVVCLFTGLVSVGKHPRGYSYPGVDLSQLEGCGLPAVSALGVLRRVYKLYLAGV